MVVLFIAKEEMAQLKKQTDLRVSQLVSYHEKFALWSQGQALGNQVMTYV